MQQILPPAGRLCQVSDFSGFSFHSKGGAGEMLSEMDCENSFQHQPLKSMQVCWSADLLSSGGLVRL